MANIAAYAEGFWTIADWRQRFPGSCRDWNVRFIYQGPNLEGQRAWWVYWLVNKPGPSPAPRVHDQPVLEYFRGVVLA